MKVSKSYIEKLIKEELTKEGVLDTVKNVMGIGGDPDAGREELGKKIANSVADDTNEEIIKWVEMINRLQAKGLSVEEAIRKALMLKYGVDRPE